MSVHYKFKSHLSYDTIAFDGLHISVRDLKKAILHQKQIGKSTDYDLQITNAQSNEVYVDDGALIPKNSSLIVSRIPLTAQQKKAWEKSDAAQLHLIGINKGESPDHILINKFAKSTDLTSVDGSEEDKIQAAIHQSTRDYDPSNYVRIKHSNQVGEVPPSYRCYKCMQPGHWIKDCKLNINQDASVEIKKSTGIPRSFMVPVEGPEVPGAMMTPSGHFAVPTIDHEARRELPKKADPIVSDKPPIPDDLVCGVCKDLLTDAVMIPCCGNSFCDDCIRNVLLESDDHQCPDCKEKDVSPDTLIPSRFLRNCVGNFRNQTGYTRTIPLPTLSQANRPQVEPAQVVQATTEQPRSNSAAPQDVQGGAPLVPTGGAPLVTPSIPPVQPTVPHHIVHTQPPPGIPPNLLSQHGIRLPHINTNVPPPRIGIPPTSLPPQVAPPGVRPPSLTQQPTVTIEVPDGDDDIRPGSPAGKSIPSLTAPLPHNPYMLRNTNLNPPFLAQSVAPPGTAPHAHPPYSSYRGGRGDGMYGSDYWGSRGRGYQNNIRPHASQSHQTIHHPPHLHFTQGGGYVFQPAYPPGTRPDGSDSRSDYSTDYRGRIRSLGDGDALEIFEKLMKEKDRKRERGRSRSRSYSRSWSRSPVRWSSGRSRSRTPKGRSRSPKGRSRSPKPRSRSKGRSRSPKGRSRSPVHKRTPPMKRSPKRSPITKSKAPLRPRSRSPHKRSMSRSRSRSPYTKRRSRSRSRSKSYSYSSRYYGERKYKMDSRIHKPAIRSSVYKTHDYGSSLDHARYGDRYDREYQTSRNYSKPYDNSESSRKAAGEWEQIRDREFHLRKMESENCYGGEVRDRKERELSANRIIQDIIEKDKERDRINEKEPAPLIQSERLTRSPSSIKEKSPDKDKKSRREKKKKRDEDKEKKRKKKKSREKEEKVSVEREEPPKEKVSPSETKPVEPPAEPPETTENVSEDKQEISKENEPVVTEQEAKDKPKVELFKPDDLYKDLGANVDMKPFENSKEEKPDSPIKKVTEPDSTSNKDVMLAPVPELSKWEKDEDILMSQNDARPLELFITEDFEDLEEKQVTSEVLKRAENAIFKKGVNPIKENVKPEKKEKKEKEEKKEVEEKKPREELKHREEKVSHREREDKRDRDEKREERDRRREREKTKEMHFGDEYMKEGPVKEMKPLKSIALPMKVEMEEPPRRRKAVFVYHPEKEKTRISAKERLGAKVDDKSSKRDCKYTKIPKSDQEVFSSVLHNPLNHQERKVWKTIIDNKDEGKKDQIKRKGENFILEISDEDRRGHIKEPLPVEPSLGSKRRSVSLELIAPLKKKSKHALKLDQSSEEGSSDESAESPKKQKKKKKNKKKKKSKKKSKSKHDSSSDSDSSSSSSESESDDESKKKRKHKHKSRKKSKKHKKSKK